MKSKIYLIAFWLGSFFCYSQEFKLSGTVSDGTMPLPGVSVLVKGTSFGTQTDLDGKFTLSGISSGSVVTFSFIGFEEYEHLVNDNAEISVTLKEDQNLLDEVVIIGYGTQRKRDVTGAVSVVEAKTLDRLKPVKVEQALQGTVSGVNVTARSGAPGADFDIRIRGIATNGVNSPTVIIDGYVGELGLLNPNDIESITVLKDAQAAIYGTIGANGVILVTTKSGKRNTKTTFNYNTYTGFQETSRKIPMLNATEYALLVNESYANGGQVIPYPNVTGLGIGTDWQNEVFSTGVPIINHDINISGGSDKITYSISGSHIDQEGIVGGDKSGFLRNTARVALGADLTEKLKVSTNVIYTYFNRKSLNENNLGSVLFNALNAPPTLNPYNSDGTHTLIPSTTGLGIEVINPLAQIANTHNDYDYRKINGNFGLEYQLFEDFKINSSIGFNTSNSESRDFGKQISYGGKVFDNIRSYVTQGAIKDNNYSFDLYGTYSKTLWDDHNIVATLGNTVFKSWGNGLFATGYDIPYNSWEFADISLANGLPTSKNVGSYVYDERRLSYFGRLQYDYKGKYLFSAMLRRDASTHFGPEERVAIFPSFTAGWVVSDESFFGESKYIDFLKIRASYGTLGNDQIGSNRYTGLLNGEATYVLDGVLVNGLAQGVLANPRIHWEESEKLDIGIDMNFFGRKLEFVADYFIDKRNSLLIQYIPVSGITGVYAPGSGSPTANAGSVENRGLELALNFNHSFSDDFSISAGYNVTFLKNKVLAVDNGTGFIESGAFGVGNPAPTRMEVGMPMGYFYGYVTDGIFQNQSEVDSHPSQIALGAEASPGDIRYVDINGDGVIDSNDRTNIGNAIPDAVMGFNFQMNYKGFDFSCYTFASVGNDLIRNYERTLNDVNRLNYTLDRWTGEGTSNSTPRVTTGATTNTVFSDYYVEDASYIRIQNVQLGYTIPKDFFGKTGLDRVRIYVAANNLYTFTKYKGFDPGANSGDPIAGGIDYGFYPIPRTYMLGVNINF